ncbi:DUF4260 domain-containing protein [Sedimentibacter sp.]|uniref:DUF4260 domain-containing protein n=1 Tax=Sedimentibacter sp. TaxID=1960295 RepID=UPI00289E5140|nr:DUF4260 domain-containing protein [Sedimentibacter sp.]
MKNLIRLEEIMIFGLSIYLFSLLNYSWWLFWGLLLTPDLGMLGYALNTNFGAIVYNVVHHRGLQLIIYFLGAFLGIRIIMLIGVILFAHSSLDRVFSFGLKYIDNFKHTHLN